MSWIRDHDLVPRLLQLVQGDVLFKEDAAILSYDLDVRAPVLLKTPRLLGLVRLQAEGRDAIFVDRDPLGGSILIFGNASWLASQGRE